MDRIKKELGKIQSASFGHGGYQNAQIGVFFAFEGDGWGTGDFWGFWNGERNEDAQWTEMDRLAALGATVMRLDQILLDAEVNSVENMVGVPVEITFDHWKMVSWRVLKEVL